MKEQFNIIGKISSEEEKRVTKILNKEKKWEPLKGEHEKNSEERKIINATKSFLAGRGN